MRNPLFQQMLEQYVPRVNKVIMDGLACEAMKQVEEYIDIVFKSAAQSFPPGFEYVGYDRCTPYEEYIETTKQRNNNQRTFDTAQSDIYLVKYYFRFQGRDIKPTVHIYLPFVREAGIMFLNGAMYHITPVLSDKVISPGFDTVFVRLLRDKINFKRLYHSIIVNDVRETTYVIWSQIHRKMNDKKVEQTTRAETCLSHYLFGQYGFSKTFEKYCGFIPVVGQEDITEAHYPKDQFVICQSAQIKPKTHVGGFYEPSSVRLAIPIAQWTPMTKSLVSGFYYVLDHFPERFKPQYLDNINLWRILLGHIIYSGAYGENKLYTNISEHFSSLDDYVDTIIIDKLKERGYFIKNFYDLIALIAEQFNSMILDSENAALSMYGKSLEVLYYVLYDITSGIFKVNFSLNKHFNNPNKKPLTFDDVKEILHKFLKPRAVLNLASGKIITESVSYSGDHKYPKITSKITEQESLPGATRGKSKRFVLDQSKHIDISMVVCGSILFLPKSNPTPISKVNPYINVDFATGTVLPNPLFDDILNETAKRIKGL